MTIIFCAFEGKPLTLRIYGTVTVYHKTDPEWQLHIGLFPDIAGARQLMNIKIEKIQTSCGFAVPYMRYQGERQQLKAWAEKQGEQRLDTYRSEKNQLSIDGFDTGIPM